VLCCVVAGFWEGGVVWWEGVLDTLGRERREGGSAWHLSMGIFVIFAIWRLGICVWGYPWRVGEVVTFAGV
jgi:hypothetical protein